MNDVTRLINSVLDPWFEKDDQGRTVFFPGGCCSKGRILPDAATEERIRSRVCLLFMLFLGLGFLMPPLNDVFPIRENLHWVILFGMQASYAQHLYLHDLVRGLPISDLPPKRPEIVFMQFCSPGRIWLVSMVALSTLIVTFGLAAAILESGSNRLIALGLAAYFGAALSLYTRQLRALDSGSGCDV